MKILSLVTLLSMAATASANCASMKFTFNLKPKFPGGRAENYACGDLDLQDIEAILQDVPQQMSDMGYEQISMNNIKEGTRDCPSFPCSIHPGDKCLPYCFDVSFCPGEELQARQISVIDPNHISKLQQIEIDKFRGKFPKCLGIRNQFMMDLHFSMIDEV